MIEQAWANLDEVLYMESEPGNPTALSNCSEAAEAVRAFGLAILKERDEMGLGFDCGNCGGPHKTPNAFQKVGCDNYLPMRDALRIRIEALK